LKNDTKSQLTLKINARKMKMTPLGNFIFVPSISGEWNRAQSLIWTCICLPSVTSIRLYIYIYHTNTKRLTN